MLMRDAAQVKKDTFDDIFRFDVDELKRKAACDVFRNDENLQQKVSERMKQELNAIEAKMTKSSPIDLTDIRLETKADLNVASGLLE